MKKNDRLSLVTKLLAREAAAYVRSGLLAPGGSRAVRDNGARSDFGVLFVPGVGANASQFSALKSALAPECSWFDAFEYSVLTDPRATSKRLRRQLIERSAHCSRMLVIGHSLGGLLLRIALQEDGVPQGVVGFVSICAPLHGTWRARLAINPYLRALAPDGALLGEVYKSAARLDALKGSVLTIGSSLDSFITPHDSAFIEGDEQVLLEDTGHVGALFDPRVHQAVIRLAARLKLSSAADRPKDASDPRSRE